MMLVYFDAMGLVAAWLVLVGILGVPLWLFLSGVMRGYYGEARWNASNGLLRRRWSMKYSAVALLIALGGSLVAEIDKRRERKELEASDPCRYLRAEMQRKHPGLDDLAIRHVREMMALEKRERRRQLFLELQSLSEPDLLEDPDRATEYALRQVEREHVMNRQNAEAWRELSERHEWEWAKACELAESAPGSR
ncbi:MULTISPECIES: hypothetical protein [Myxococcus]|uniref:hypothetical protein n=1 Tax=Myxococcus TaxID=32 RepID=UPI001143461B|nr:MULTISPECIES: hypothetical protein [Myxococcus]NOJ53461.1 hypothetical protein [Myxococcus xanthus]QPM80869.1 hypothetical protein I5Q59_06105 [Myxococcus xanthus]QVW69929.1 hypothetical protein JTM82_10395 [Myxococcus xanthus DZ2]UEO03942.1 hypothetical protein K1515_32415 [Myxococcus xanthus DZ2]UYI15866.1 hypothetical protein N3T43_06010 [Myxococcus xanthus]